MFNFSPDLSEFRINANVYPLVSLVKLPSVCYTIFYVFTYLVGLYCAVRVVVKRRFRWSPEFFFFLMLLFFTLPVILHPEPRFLIPILIPMTFFFAHGITIASGFFPHPIRARRVIAWVLIAVMTAGAGIYLAGARNLIFTLKKEVEASRTARFLEGLPADGIMAQVGYPPELSYLTGKRVVALPITPRGLDEFIRRYDIRYLLYGQRYWVPISVDDPSLIWCYYTIKHIRNHPEKYPLIRAVDETYRSGAPPDRIFIHGVRKE